MDPQLGRGARKVGAPVRHSVCMYALAPLCEWAVWIAVLVEAYERSGATTGGRVALVLLGPPMLVTPLAARAAGGPRPIAALRAVFAVQAAALALGAIATAAAAPIALTTIATTVALCGVPFARPCVQVAMPGLVASSAELVAANAAVGTVDGGASLLGPLGAAALLTVGGPSTVFAVAAVLMAVDAALAGRLALRSATADDDAPAGAGCDAPGLRHATGALARRTSPGLLVTLAVPSMLLGALDLLSISLSLGPLGLGASGAGWLGALFGCGAVAAGATSRRLLERPGLTRSIIASLLVIGVTTLVLATWTGTAIAVGVFAVLGAGRATIDVCARTLLQRATNEGDLGVTFAVVELCSAIGILVGSLLTQLLLAAGGTDTALLGLAITFVVTGASARRSLRRADAVAHVPHVEVRLLRRAPLLARLPAPALEQLARTAHHATYPDGAVVVHQDEPGDRYFVIVDGSADVRIDGVHVRTMSSGAGFGEIALLADLPRTATVVACTPLAVLTIDRASFRTAVLGHDATSAAAWAVARRLHPPLRITDPEAGDD